MSKEVVLPSGAKLHITPAPFECSLALYEAIMEEMKDIKIDKNESQINFYKNIACLCTSSKKVKAAFLECMSRCTYNGARIKEDTWEPVKAREDYVDAFSEIIMENVGPFMKSLFAQLRVLLAKFQDFHA